MGYPLTFLLTRHKEQANAIDAPMEISRMPWISTICEVMTLLLTFLAIREKIRQDISIAAKKTIKIRSFLTKLARSPWFAPILTSGLAIYGLHIDLHRTGVITRWDIYLISKDVVYVAFGAIAFFVLAIVGGMQSILTVQGEMLNIQK